MISNAQIELDFIHFLVNMLEKNVLSPCFTCKNDAFQIVVGVRRLQKPICEK